MKFVWVARRGDDATVGHLDSAAQRKVVTSDFTEPGNRYFFAVEQPRGFEAELRSLKFSLGNLTRILFEMGYGTRHAGSVCFEI